MSNLPVAQQKAMTIRNLLDKSKDQLKMAIPRHLTVDRLLRVAMTSIRTNPKLMDCTPESLLACVMGCAQLGLEPEPFLGQAYLVPFKNKRLVNGKETWVMECQLIPGYRGYLSLARRSGEVKSVTSQVVYEQDHFTMKYGLDETLDHIPADGDRGNPKGAYVVFRYKDGSHSFDYMSTADIEKVRARSKAAGSGPWVTDWPEMAKKTVIRRHIKIVPLSVEMAQAVAAEERFFAGESQADIFGGTQEAEFSEVSEDRSALIAAFDKMAQEKKVDRGRLDEFLTTTAEAQELTVDDIKCAAAGSPQQFWKAFEKWQGQQKTETPPPANGQGPIRGITESQTEKLNKLMALKGIPLIDICQDEGVSAVSEMDYDTAQKAIVKLEAI